MSEIDTTDLDMHLDMQKDVIELMNIAAHMVSEPSGVVEIYKNIASMPGHASDIIWQHTYTDGDGNLATLSVKATFIRLVGRNTIIDHDLGIRIGIADVFDVNLERASKLYPATTAGTRTRAAVLKAVNECLAEYDLAKKNRIVNRRKQALNTLKEKFPNYQFNQIETTTTGRKITLDV